MNMENKLLFPDNFIDKYGAKINEDDVIYDGKNYFRIYWNERQSQVEAISPTYGYLHNIKKDFLINFERVGSFTECEKLMETD